MRQTAVDALTRPHRMQGVGLSLVELTVRAGIREYGPMSRLRLSDTEIAFETLGGAGPVIVFEAGLGQDMRLLGEGDFTARGSRAFGPVRQTRWPQQPAQRGKFAARQDCGRSAPVTSAKPSTCQARI